MSSRVSKQRWSRVSAIFAGAAIVFTLGLPGQGSGGQTALAAVSADALTAQSEYLIDGGRSLPSAGSTRAAPSLKANNGNNNGGGNGNNNGNANNGGNTGGGNTGNANNGGGNDGNNNGNANSNSGGGGNNGNANK